MEKLEKQMNANDNGQNDNGHYHSNDNGQKLVQWCEKNKTFLCNTAFQHKTKPHSNTVKLSYQLKHQQSTSHIQPN